MAETQSVGASTNNPTDSFHFGAPVGGIIGIVAGFVIGLLGWVWLWPSR